MELLIPRINVQSDGTFENVLEPTIERNPSYLDKFQSCFATAKLSLAVIVLALTTTFWVGQGAYAQQLNWVTTWSASPSTLAGNEESTAQIVGQTLRIIAHTSVGGKSLRLRLSNVHGSKRLKIGAVSVALQNEGSSIDSASLVSLSFGDKDSIEIPKGAVVITDPIDFAVPDTANLSISIYIPEESGFITAHGLSNQINYVSIPGDHNVAADFPVATETPAWNFLTAIDVVTETPVTAIVTLGDSITDGWASTASLNQRWPNHFANRLYADSTMPRYAVVNAGISGNRVTTEGSPLFGQNLQARFERDVLALSNVSHIVLLEGINDIGMSARSEDGQTGAEEIITGYRQIIARAHARGIKVIGAPLTPYEGAAYYSEAGEVIRNTVNHWIRNSGEFDGFIDFEKAVQDPQNPSRILPAYTTDNLHPNDVGYKAMAESIDLSLFR